ncbi:hypothetical protein OFM15_32610, partial [Escherichia coli]|nr:hypothetical protein [Escherichia coli]
MSHTDALALIKAEALRESGLVVATRMGRDLEPARVARLVSVIRTVADSLQGARSIDREPA